jgi:hypothetical protein
MAASATQPFASPIRKPGHRRYPLQCLGASVPVFAMLCRYSRLRVK